MSRNHSPVCGNLSIHAKWIISLLIACHFIGIFTAVAVTADTRGGTPILPGRLTAVFRPYLEFLFLDSAYQFFAPNPTPTKKFYFRIVGRDGLGQWVEFPRKEDYFVPFMYHRSWKIAQNSIRRSGGSKQVLDAETYICLASFVRRIGREFTNREHDVGQEAQWIDVYEVRHRPMSPAEAARGLSQTNASLYRPSLLGRFTVDGSPLRDGRVRSIRMARLAEGIVQNDVLPRLKQRADMETTNAVLALADAVGVPAPIRSLIAGHPELIDGSALDLPERVSEAIEEDDPLPE